MRVLHVIESLGGVFSSVLTMVDATPDIDHHLAVWPRREHLDTGDGHSTFASVEVLPSAPHRARPALRALTRELRPGIVHAHSSYAGALARAGDIGADIAYSPHCFAFERQDLGPFVRGSYRELERSLVRRTSVLVACSPHEASLAVGLGHSRVVMVPNRALNPPDVRAGFADPFRVVTVGRISPQKDWRHLIALKQQVDRRGAPRMVWEWLGGGDADDEAELRVSGIAVSGWLPRQEVVDRLGSAQAYVHTAAWEGAPVAILEAAAVGLPMAVRAIPTLESLDVPGLAAGVEGLAERLVGLRDPLAWARAQHQSLRFSAEHSASVQRYRLNAAYQHAPARLAAG